MLFLCLYYCKEETWTRNKIKKKKALYSLCSRDKSVQMPVILVEDLSGARLSGGLQPDNDALRWTVNTSITLTGPLCSLVSVTSSIIGQNKRGRSFHKTKPSGGDFQGRENALRDKSASPRNTVCQQSAQDSCALLQHLDELLDAPAPRVIQSHCGIMDTTRLRKALEARELR